MNKPLFLYIPLSERILFAKHLSIMVKTGMTLLNSLNLIKKQMRSKSFIYVLNQVINDIEGGQFLSQSLKRFEHLFDPIFINVIRIGEASGNLPENLLYLSSELQKKQELRKKVRSAMIYPSIIVLATTGVTGVLAFFVMPRINPVFTSLGITLPWTTKFLVASSQFLYQYGLYILLGIFLLVIAWIILLRSFYGFRLFMHRLILRLPFFGSVSRMANHAEFTRTLGLLLKSGTKIVEAVTVTADSMGNLAYREALLEAAETVKRGELIHVYLSKHEDLFFSTASRMIEVGDATGTLETNLFYLADFYENEVDEATKTLSSVLEPVMLLIMGIIVGFVAISIITPIYEITQILK